MLGLIKKDLFMIKGNLKILGIVFIIFVFMAFQGMSDLTIIPAFLSIMIFMSTFSYDEYNKWDAYAITLPNGRENIVKAKYLATIILTIVTVTLTVIINVTIGLFQKNFNYEEMFSVMAGVTVAIIFIQALIYPLIFKWGIEKGRIGLFVVVFGVTSIITLLMQQGINPPKFIIMLLTNYWMIIIPVITLGTLFISYLISKKLYLNKEF